MKNIKQLNYQKKKYDQQSQDSFSFKKKKKFFRETGS